MDILTGAPPTQLYTAYLVVLVFFAFSSRDAFPPVSLSTASAWSRSSSRRVPLPQSVRPSPPGQGTSPLAIRTPGPHVHWPTPRRPHLALAGPAVQPHPQAMVQGPEPLASRMRPASAPGGRALLWPALQRLCSAPATPPPRPWREAASPLAGPAAGARAHPCACAGRR